MLTLRTELLVIFMLWTGTVVAQSEVPPEVVISADSGISQAEQDAEDKARAIKAAEEKAAAEKSKAEEAEKVFIPTEEISEDKPVPFPVDI